MLLLLASLSLATPPADARGADAPATPPDTPDAWGLGVRAGVWAAEQAAPQVGGHLEVRLSDRARVQGFATVSGRRTPALDQADALLGFDLSTPLTRRGRSTLAGTLGSCVDFRHWRDRATGEGLRTDVLFGPRVGLRGRHRLAPAWSVQASATGVLYVGNTEGTYTWGAASRGLRVAPVAEVHLGLTRHFRAP